MTAGLVTNPALGSIPIGDRLYARALALTVRGGPTSDAAAELLDLVNGDPHLLGAARERCAVLAREYPDSPHADRAQALVRYAWLAAIAAA
ncbi:MAG TPA: hypothetical protein VI916_08480 [Acidimicrobiia bacterium]|nr:hypothetical protein [Acidimicrobiia bacterium]